MKKLRHCHPICIIYHYKTLPSPCDHVRTLAHRAEGLSSAATRRIGAAALRFERVSRQFRKSSPLTALPCRRRVRAVHTCSCCLSAEVCDARSVQLSRRNEERDAQLKQCEDETQARHPDTGNHHLVESLDAARRRRRLEKTACNYVLYNYNIPPKIWRTEKA